jgi:hypothetical protein
MKEFFIIFDDNRISNLYLCSSQSKHGKMSKSIFKLVDSLLKNKIILFKGDKYVLNKRERGANGSSR